MDWIDTPKKEIQDMNVMELIEKISDVIKITALVLYLYCIKTLFKDTSPVNGALISTGGVYKVKNYKRYKEKKTIYKLV